VVGVPPQARGRAFGLHRAADTAGAVVGPLIGLALYVALDERIRPLLVVAVVPAVLSVLLVAAVREGPRAAPTAPARQEGRLPPPFWRVVAVLVAVGLVNVPDALLLLRVSELGAPLTTVIALYVLYNLSYALLSYPAGALSDRWPRHVVYAAGLTCFAVAYLGLGLVDSTDWVPLLLVVYGGFAACTDGVGKAWVSELVPAGRQGTAQGVYQGLTGGAVLVAGTWAGLAWSGDGRLPLLLAGAVGAAAAVLLAVRGGRLGAARTAVGRSGGRHPGQAAQHV
jgi:MFS family permease